jgi:hypothetical protein
MGKSFNRAEGIARAGAYAILLGMLAVAVSPFSG